MQLCPVFADPVTYCNIPVIPALVENKLLQNIVMNMESALIT